MTMLASVVQTVALLQLAWPALLLLAGSGAAARKGRSRVRHFAMPFASTVVNAANADHAPRCVCVAPHGCVLCTWLCGIHCVPRRGATALLGMQHGTSAHGSGSSNGCSGVGAAVAMACECDTIPLASEVCCKSCPDMDGLCDVFVST